MKEQFLFYKSDFVDLKKKLFYMFFRNERIYVLRLYFVENEESFILRLYMKDKSLT